MLFSNPKIAVIGLGYVGLPLSVALAQHFTVVGFDINTIRIEELQKGLDRTGEIESSALSTTTLQLTDNPADLHDIDIFIVTVPTPVHVTTNLPDLEPLQKASLLIGTHLKKGAIVVYESTVYPGVTEDFCGPLLEKASGLQSGVDFYLGYSPERINPGDKEHTVHTITKVVSGQNEIVAAQLAALYGMLNQNNIYIARNIKTAEAAKVIENAQRDINIAFVNEVAIIMQKMHLCMHDVLAAATTKWNFLPFKPGLVGGHCIGVDPYYLAHAAQITGYEPHIILSGRRINESMGEFIASIIYQKLQEIFFPSNTVSPIRLRLLILGLTFKENIPDLRNTKVIDLINALKKYNIDIAVHDALADVTEAKQFYNIDLLPQLQSQEPYHAIVGAVAHKDYCEFTNQHFNKLLQAKGLVADIQGMWHHLNNSSTFHYWTL